MERASLPSFLPAHPGAAGGQDMTDDRRSVVCQTPRRHATAPRTDPPASGRDHAYPGTREPQREARPEQHTDHPPTHGSTIHTAVGEHHQPPDRATTNNRDRGLRASGP
eukprot:scaffold179418_cov32-Tisochrysis_lutea.AAC.1